MAARVRLAARVALIGLLLFGTGFILGWVYNGWFGGDPMPISN